MFLAEHSRLFSLVVLALLLSFGIIAFLNTMQETFPLLNPQYNIRWWKPHGRA